MVDMRQKYGKFSQSQISLTKKDIRKQIIFLLSIADPELKDKYQHIDVKAAFQSLLDELSGLNELLFQPPELVRVMSLLEAALKEYNSKTFDFSRYRKLILDAGAEVNAIKEVDDESNS